MKKKSLIEAIEERQAYRRILEGDCVFVGDRWFSAQGAEKEIKAYDKKFKKKEKRNQRRREKRALSKDREHGRKPKAKANSRRA